MDSWWKESKRRFPCTSAYWKIPTSPRASSTRTSWNASRPWEESEREAGLFPPLYAILDPSLTPAPAVEIAERLAAAGVSLIQLRDKHSPAGRVCEQARALLTALAPHGARLIVNDRPDIAAIAGAGGVHVGQEDLPVEAARSICGAERWVGVSTHNLAELREAAATSADYIAFGPIFP